MTKDQREEQVASCRRNDQAGKFKTQARLGYAADHDAGAGTGQRNLKASRWLPFPWRLRPI